MASGRDIVNVVYRASSSGPFRRTTVCPMKYHLFHRVNGKLLRDTRTKSSSSSRGTRPEEFENSIIRYAGVDYAVAVNGGTSALHLIIRGLGIGEGDEVITASFCCLLLSCVL